VRAAVGFVMILILLGGLSSCGKPKRPPTTDIPGYQALRDRVGDFDFSPLRGRRLVIDPGHGGFFRGAVGLNGLTEAEVNLGVALYLRGLLEWAGAEVFLTRTADYDFLSPADSSLATDLAARVAFCDSIAPDVFLSIHHNSNAALDRDLNETQTYYPVGREGADLDLARSIHKYLVRNLEIEPAKIMAGNFYVLRNATVPAVLGEPAMISNPVIEGRLTLARSHELEAKAYFLGLLEYYALGTPRFVNGFEEATVNFPWEQLVWHFEPGSPLAPGLDPATVTFIVDGVSQPVTLSPDARNIYWTPDPETRWGNHTISLQGRNLAGRSTPVHLVQYKGFVNWLLELELWRDRRGADSKMLLIWKSTALDLDAYGPFRLNPAGGPGTEKDWEEATELPRYPGKVGWALLPGDFPLSATLLWDLGDDQNRNFQGIKIRPEDQGKFHRGYWYLPPGWRFIWLEAAAEFWPNSVVPGQAWQARVRAQDPSLTGGRFNYCLHRIFYDPRVPAVSVQDSLPFWLEAPGALPIFADENHHEPWAEPGSAPPDTFFWQPVLPELIDKVIVLDPHGGGSETDGAGPLGTRGADLNLRLAEKTASLLRGAGAEVILTRTDERWVPPEEKVLLANERGADLFLTLRRSQDPAGRITAAHHHGSRVGTTWAELTARAAAPLAGGDSSLVGGSYAYLLRHTACPALQVGLPPLADLAAEEKLTAPSHQQATARALLLGCAALQAGEQILNDQFQPGPLLAIHPDLFPPLERIDWIQLDGNFQWLPPRWGGTAGETVPLSAAPPTAPGLPCRGEEHFLEIHAGPSWQLWAFRRAPDRRVTLKKLLENR